jgi:hypothetical protein
LDTIPATGTLYVIWTEAPNITVTYNSTVITTMNASGAEILETNGKMMADDITIDFTKPPAPSLQAKTNIAPS